MHMVVGIWRLGIAALAFFSLRSSFTPSGLADYAFFTSQSNLIVAVVFAWAGLATILRGDLPPAWLKGGATLYIAITALVSLLVLDPEEPGNAVVFLGFTDAGLKHELIPILVGIDFLLVDRHRRLKWVYAAWWLLYPVAYLVFATIRGGFWPHVGYPYGFVDVHEIGYLGLVQNIVIYGIAFWVLGLAIVGLDRLLPARSLVGAGTKRQR